MTDPAPFGLALAFSAGLLSFRLALRAAAHPELPHLRHGRRVRRSRQRRAARRSCTRCSSCSASRSSSSRSARRPRCSAGARSPIASGSRASAARSWSSSVSTCSASSASAPSTVSDACTSRQADGLPRHRARRRRLRCGWTPCLGPILGAILTYTAAPGRPLTRPAAAARVFARPRAALPASRRWRWSASWRRCARIRPYLRARVAGERGAARRRRAC